MRRHPLAGLALAAVLGGVLVAFALAVAVGGGDGGRAAQPLAVAGADPLARGAAAAGDPRAPSEAPPRRDVRGFRQSWLKATGPVRIEARAPDPRGGPPFAVRVFAAQDMVERRDGTLKPGGKPDRCAQLGRIHRGRFGWIDGRNVFRPAGIVSRAAPILCGSPAADLGREPLVEVLNRMTDATRSAARPIQSVVWGFAGADGEVGLRIDGRRRAVPRTRNGAVLVPLVGGLDRRPAVSARARYPGGPPIVTDLGFRAAGKRSPTLEYSVPDPNGGLPWGVVAAPVDGGGWCVSAVGRVVGERVTDLYDGALGTFRDASRAHGRGCRHLATSPTLRRPLALSFHLGAGGGGEQPRGAVARRARIERRVTGSQAVFSGIAHPDVESVTVTSPTAVRTMVPSPRAHAIVLVEEGGGGAGTLELSARMRDGTVHREPSFRLP
jgi:hypothetical protein